MKFLLRKFMHGRGAGEGGIIGLEMGVGKFELGGGAAFLGQKRGLGMWKRSTKL
ncbi:MAG: hypothetical protein JSV99_04410 [Planctomycetota bacterium]|nr:MAG: hypothetical protein JSV99_04410 [Planctomycetota bacterium]